MTERHVLGLSGGRDSAALAIFMRQYEPETPVEYFFTDTGKELPEVYEFLARLEGFLGEPIHRLNPDRDFDFWLREYGQFLPSPKTRWCTRQLKLRPFEEWIKRDLDSGNGVVSYVAIRADEPYRSGHVATHPRLTVRFPFREQGVDMAGVIELLETSGLGLPTYYRWRSRSGCTFCFYQQKIEWVRLKLREDSTSARITIYLERSRIPGGARATGAYGGDRGRLRAAARPRAPAPAKKSSAGGFREHGYRCDLRP
jgi:hypothetical protein